MRKLIRANGEERELHGPLDTKQITELIGASVLDTVLLVDRVHVMLLDDLGYHKELPVNAKATVLYLKKCKPGTTHVIRGDVVVVPDEDFA